MIASAFEYPVFYTFSTIAQTLAGAIALLGAFALYRLQSLVQSIEEDANVIASRYDIAGPHHTQTNQEQAATLLAERQYRGLLEFVSRTPLPADFYQATRERERLRRDLDTSDSLRSSFNASLWLTVALMSFSVAALVFASTILASPYAPLLLCCALIWFVICVISYVVLIRIALRWVTRGRHRAGRPNIDFAAGIRSFLAVRGRTPRHIRGLSTRRLPHGCDTSTARKHRVPGSMLRVP